ncbi:MAG: hypothetical protein HZB53_04225 [Chloroflexi bacterium]|nr:hypothetical protein [Chloroflexota bacterium]
MIIQTGQQFFIEQRVGASKAGFMPAVFVKLNLQAPRTVAVLNAPSRAAKRCAR